MKRPIDPKPIHLKEDCEPQPEPQLKDAAVDCVEEASQESFPASDPPSWTVSTGEKGSNTEPDSPKTNPNTLRCTTSFLTQERGEIGGVCGELQPDPKEEYVPSDKEKETGGEG
jgi:hypothetical protein